MYFVLFIASIVNRLCPMSCRCLLFPQIATVGSIVRVLGTTVSTWRRAASSEQLAKSYALVQCRAL